MYETSFVVYPQDTNALKMDMIFGGKMLSEFDKISSIECKNVMREANLDKSLYAVTVGVDKVSFSRPAFVGDLVRMTANYEDHGKTSIKIKVKAYVENLSTGKKLPMANGTFTFCVVRRDEDGNNIPVEHGL